MQLGEQQIEILAELKDMPAFVLLLAIYREFEAEILGELARAIEPDDLTRLGRFYQIFRAVREQLETAPQGAWNQLKILSESKFDLSQVDPQFLDPTTISQLRFSRTPESGEADLVRFN